LEWSEFAERLGRELARLDPDTILIIREHDEDRHYVQAMREPDRLYAEAVSNNFLEGPLALTPADEDVLTETGWQPPTADWAPANWWTELPPLATVDDFARLADMLVTALRDVQGLRRPAELVYESFNRHGTGLIELVDFGITHADPTRITERRGADATADEQVAQAAEQATEQAAGQVAEQPDVQAAPALDVDDADLEARLADAKRRGDRTTCFELLLATELVLLMTGQAAEGTDPAGPAPALTEFTTTTIDTRTCLMAFTSPEAMTRALGAQNGGIRPATFGRLAAGWPDPQWSLVVNAGLPSEIHLDSAAISGLDGMRRTAEQASAVDAVVHAAPSDTAGTAAVDAASGPRPAIRLPHGVQLWRYDGDSAAPVAVYDAPSARWSGPDTDLVTGQAPQQAE
jgi:hypothetical protein